jgi:hypothetical protein
MSKGEAYERTVEPWITDAPEAHKFHGLLGDGGMK